jgi:hypothetical protein
MGRDKKDNRDRESVEKGEVDFGQENKKELLITITIRCLGTSFSYR